MYATMMEELETRTCLDAVAFAGVGYGYIASDWDGYLLDAAAARYDGTADLDTGVVTYDTWVSAPGGEQPGTMGRQSIRNFKTLDDGRVTGIYETNAFDPAFGYPIEAAGTIFLESEGYPIGWSMTEWGGPEVYGETKVFQLLVEKPQSASLQQLSGRWEVVTLFNSWTEDILATGTGYFTISGSDIDGQLTFEGGLTLPIDEQIQTVSPNGLVRDGDGDFFQLSADGNVLLFAGMDTSAVFGVGVAFRRDPQPSWSEMPGTYRIGSLYSGDPAWMFNDTTVAIGTSVLELDSSGQFSIYDTTVYDVGSRVPLVQGSWSLQQGRVMLSDGIDSIELLSGHDGRALYMTSYAGSPLLSVGVRVLDTVDQYTLAGQGGSVVRAASESTDTSLAVARNADGDLIVFRNANSGWEAMRLSDHTSAPRATGDALIWTDPNDGLIYVAGPSVAGFVLYQRNSSGDWSYRNLSTETTAGDNAPVGTLTYFITRPPNGSPQVMIAGANAMGQIVALQQTGLGTAGSYQWRYYNISDDLASQGMTTPAFTELISYVTPWNAWTIAGIDANGDIQGIWVAPASFTTWRIDNLSDITGAPPISGQLTVTQTSWSAINLGGVNSTGHLVVTWWVPSFKGNWVTSDLTNASGGETLRAGKATGFVTPWGAINYAGTNAAGDVTAYWWTPQTGGWKVTSLTANLTGDRPTGSLTSHVSKAGTVSIVGLAQDQDVVRLWWSPVGDRDWYLDNLTVEAIRR